MPSLQNRWRGKTLLPESLNLKKTLPEQKLARFNFRERWVVGSRIQP